MAVRIGWRREPYKFKCMRCNRDYTTKQLPRNKNIHYCGDCVKKLKGMRG